jgi:hypothetical protein
MQHSKTSHMADGVNAAALIDYLAPARPIFGPVLGSGPSCRIRPRRFLPGDCLDPSILDGAMPSTGACASPRDLSACTSATMPRTAHALWLPPPRSSRSSLPRRRGRKARPLQIQRALKQASGEARLSILCARQREPTIHRLIDREESGTYRSLRSSKTARSGGHRKKRKYQSLGRPRIRLWLSSR